MPSFLLKALILIGELLGAAAIIAVLNWQAVAPFQESKGQHWTERARKLYPARLAAGMSILVIPLILVLGQRLFWASIAPHWLLTALAGWIGATIGTYSLGRTPG